MSGITKGGVTARPVADSQDSPDDAPRAVELSSVPSLGHFTEGPEGWPVLLSTLESVVLKSHLRFESPVRWRPTPHVGLRILPGWPRTYDTRAMAPDHSVAMLPTPLPIPAGQNPSQNRMVLCLGPGLVQRIARNSSAAAQQKQLAVAYG